MTSTSDAPGVCRRGFLGGALLLAGTGWPLTASARGPGRAVLVFHADRLHLDSSGVMEPYVPPVGLRSLDGLDEGSIRRLVYHL